MISNCFNFFKLLFNPKYISSEEIYHIQCRVFIAWLKKYKIYRRYRYYRNRSIFVNMNVIPLLDNNCMPSQGEFKTIFESAFKWGETVEGFYFWVHIQKRWRRVSEEILSITKSYIIY